MYILVGAVDLVVVVVVGVVVQAPSALGRWPESQSSGSTH